MSMSMGRVSPSIEFEFETKLDFEVVSRNMRLDCSVSIEPVTHFVLDTNSELQNSSSEFAD